MSRQRYVDIAEDIKRKIEEGEYRDRFPSYRELVVMYSTSLRTVTRVMDKLTFENVVVTTPGIGSKLINKGNNNG